MSRARAVAARLKAELLRREKCRRLAVIWLAEFVRQAWHVLETRRLDWNWHHDALCDHVQLMLEEWWLAGMLPDEVDETLTQWAAEAWNPTRAKYVADMRTHWERPVDESIEIPTPEGEPEPRRIFGCGRGTYQQRAEDLAINIGPISLKSRIIMVFAVAWFWLRVPSWEVFCSSGTPSNVTRDSIACRQLVVSNWYRDTFDVTWSTQDIKVEIKDDLDRIDKWGTTAGGTREARGSRTNVTGIHADAILVDDADDAAGVWSEAERDKIMLFAKAVGNRLKDPTRPVRIWCQQNLMEEDLTSRLVAEGVFRLAIPVEWREARRLSLYTAPFGWRDPRTAENENMQPLRYTAKYIANERSAKRLGNHGFEAQYNCNPRSLADGMFERGWWSFFRIEDAPVTTRKRPEGCRQDPPRVLKMGELQWLTITIDCSNGSETAAASNTGILVVGGLGEERFVFDDRSAVMGITAMHDAIKKAICRWAPRRALIELKAAGSSAIAELKKALADGDLKDADDNPIPIVVTAIRDVRDSKESRANAMVPTIEGGLVHLLDGAAWLYETPKDTGFVAELCSFPKSKRNDRVDALSQLMTYYRKAVNGNTGIDGGWSGAAAG